MFFKQEFITEIENNPIIGIVDACNKVFDALEEMRTSDESWFSDEHELLLEASSFIDMFITTNEIITPVNLPDVTNDIQNNCPEFMAYISGIKSSFEREALKLKVDFHRQQYRALLKSSFSYEFSQGDFDKIQALVNEIRTLIADSHDLEPDHKQRLLKRLEALQSEMHKKVSDLDRFWGLVGDAGVVLGKLGEDAKPIVDRVKEIAEIVWKTQARTEELPSDSTNPMIESNSDT